MGRENASERVYMRDVKDRGPYINYHAVVPDSLDDGPSDDAHYINRDPRADHFAATVRLKEDKNVAGSGMPLPIRTGTEPSSKSPAKLSENDVNIKPILKRKEAQVDTKPKKKVRFDPEFTDDHDEVAAEQPQDVPMVPQTGVVDNNPKLLPEGIPDYLRNPSKYTCYSLDSSEGGDDETNKRAFEDFWKLVKKSKPDDLQPDFPTELPNSVAFTPRKKFTEAVPMDDISTNSTEDDKILGSSGGIAACEANDADACEMDEDFGEAPSGNTSINARKGRQYRPKLMSDDSSS